MIPMTNIVGTLKFTNTCTNDSSKFVLIGNGKELMSMHNTYDEACAALEKIAISQTIFSTIDVLRPGETVTRHPEKTLYEDVEYDEDTFAIE